MPDIPARFVQQEGERRRRIYMEIRKTPEEMKNTPTPEATPNDWVAHMQHLGESEGLGDVEGKGFDIDKAVKHAEAIVNAVTGGEGGELPEELKGIVEGAKGIVEKFSKRTVEGAEHEFDLPAVQGELRKLAGESQERLRSIAQRALKAKSPAQLEEKLSILKRLERFLPNVEAEGLLLNPRIPAQKMITDAMNLPVQAIFRSIGVGMEHGLTAGAKTLLANFHGFSESFKDAAKLAKMTFKTGEPEFLKSLGVETKTVETYGMEAVTSAWDESPHAGALRYMYAFGHELHDWYKSGGKLIMSADQFAKSLAYRGELHTWAYYDGLEKAVQADMRGAGKLHFAELWAKRLVNESPNWLHEKAMEGMHKATFTEIDSIVKAVEHIRDEVPFGKNLWLFFRTPYNLLKQGLQISPLGFAASNWELRQGGLETRTALAKWMAGTAAAVGIGDHVLKGNITGDGPSGKNRDLWSGRQHPRSIRIGGHWISYAHLGPFADAIALSADFTEMYSASREPSTAMRGIDAALGVMAEITTHAPLLDQVFNLTHVIDSFKEGESGKAFQEFAAREASGFIPAPVRQLAQVLDPVVKKANNFKEMLGENIPGWSKHVPAKRNMYGYLVYPPASIDSNGQVSKWQYLLNDLNPLPVYGEAHKLDDVDREQYRLQYSPEAIPKYFWKEGDISVPLSDVQQDLWAQYTGHEAKPGGMDLHDRLNWLINQQSYKRMDDKQKKLEFQKMYTNYLHAGKKMLDDKFGGSLTQQAIHKQMEEQGATPGASESAPLPPLESSPEEPTP